MMVFMNTIPWVGDNKNTTAKVNPAAAIIQTAMEASKTTAE